MYVVKEILKDLINAENLSVMSPTDIINEIALNQYDEKNRHLRDREVFESLPAVIRDILLLADMDTEISMNGMLGFLENSTGLFLNETIDALEHIGADEDMKILEKIREILNHYGISTQNLRDNVNKGNLYDITNFISTHGEMYDEMADEIQEEAERLYMYSSDRNIFDNLELYIEKNKAQLIKSIT